MDLNIGAISLPNFLRTESVPMASISITKQGRKKLLEINMHGKLYHIDENSPIVKAF